MALLLELDDLWEIFKSFFKRFYGPYINIWHIRH